MDLGDPMLLTLISFGLTLAAWVLAFRWRRLARRALSILEMQDRLLTETVHLDASEGMLMGTTQRFYGYAIDPQGNYLPMGQPKRVKIDGDLWTFEWSVKPVTFHVVSFRMEAGPLVCITDMDRDDLKAIDGGLTVVQIIHMTGLHFTPRKTSVKVSRAEELLTKGSKSKSLESGKAGLPRLTAGDPS